MVAFTVLAQPTTPLLPSCAKTAPFVILGIKEKVAAADNNIPMSIALRLLFLIIKLSILLLLFKFIQLFTIAYIKGLFALPTFTSPCFSTNLNLNQTDSVIYYLVNNLISSFMNR